MKLSGRWRYPKRTRFMHGGILCSRPPYRFAHGQSGLPLRLTLSIE